MFADLLKYQDRSYWESHSIIRLDTLEEEQKYKVFSAFYAAEEDWTLEEGIFYKLPDMPGGMPSLRRTCLPAQTMHESSQFTVSFIPFSCYTIHEDISTLQSTAW